MYKTKHSLNAMCLTFFSLVMLTLTMTSKADEVDGIVRKIMAERHVLGLQLAVVKNRKIIKAGNYGLSNLQDNVAVKNSILFPINSMTKAFTGVALVQLVDRNKLDTHRLHAD